MGGCCAKQEPELSDAVAPPRAPAQSPRPPIVAPQKKAPKPAAAAPAAPQPEQPPPLTAWSTDEVGDWLENSVKVGQYRVSLANMGVDGFVLSRMEPEDLEDAVPSKADRLAIVNAAKQELEKNGPKRSGARQDYGKVLGHDRDD